MDEPLVSVVMPAYNSEGYIAQSIQSIIDQTYNNWELIIINDGSSDKSVEIVNTFNDKRIKLFHNETNCGLAVTRNKLFDLAHGDFIAILDSDDLARPDRLTKQVSFLTANQDYGMIGSWISLIDGQGIRLNKTMKYKAKPQEIPGILFLDNYFSQSSVMMRKAIAMSQKYNLEYPPCEDYDLWIRVSRITKVWNLQESLIDYRVHNSNISKTQADRREVSERLILKNQLDEIGLKVSEDQFSFYYQCLKCGAPINCSITNAWKWTSGLIHQVNIYNDPQLTYLTGYIRMKFLKMLVKSMIGRRNITKKAIV